MTWQGIMKAYEAFLPVTDETPDISLYEGNTPLLHFPHISKELGINLYGKYEGLNPTGSFKDRGMVVAVAKAKEAGSKSVICASTGNTSAAAAAYAARADMKAIVVIPEGKVAMGKLAQAAIYGAEIVQISGNFDDALEMVKEISEVYPVTLVNSVNPYRLEGQKTAALEIIDQLGGVTPDYLAIPVGNAGNISAYWKGFKSYHESHQETALPKMFGFEAEGAAAITNTKKIDSPETFATAIRIGNPASWELATQARDESGGIITSVSEEQIAEAFKTLPSKEGIFAEPGSCASIAGVYQEVKNGSIPQGAKVVAVLTGNGLKDPQSAIDQAEIDPVSLPNDKEALVEYIKKTVVQ